MRIVTLGERSDKEKAGKYQTCSRNKLTMSIRDVWSKATDRRPLLIFIECGYNLAQHYLCVKEARLTRALILGATSLVGNNILRAAIATSWEAVAFDPRDRRKRRHPSLEALEFEVAKGMESDPEALETAWRHDRNG